jgi:D-arabinose 1-dehydrogenase-like Zn-dependent alcohol dehydrogenase
MCVGAAVYSDSALRTANVRSHSRVGILGVGGLGHMAIQFAAKMGCEVVVLSQSASKREDALKFGAAEFYDLAALDGGTLPTRPVDALFLTGARQPEWEKMIPPVHRGGVISAMSVDSGDLRIPYMGLVRNGLSIQGSLPAPPHLQPRDAQVCSNASHRSNSGDFQFHREGNQRCDGKTPWQGHEVPRRCCSRLIRYIGTGVVFWED